MLLTINLAVKNAVKKSMADVRHSLESMKNWVSRLTRTIDELELNRQQDNKESKDGKGKNTNKIPDDDFLYNDDFVYRYDEQIDEQATWDNHLCWHLQCNHVGIGGNNNNTNQNNSNDNVHVNDDPLAKVKL